LLLPASSALGENRQSQPETPDAHSIHEHHTASESSLTIGIDEKLGQRIPLNLTFSDEQGRRVGLEEFFRKPVILSLVYYTCPSVCPRIMSGIAQVLGRMQMDSGESFSVVTVSFDETDVPAAALAKKKNYIKAIGKPFPDDDWRFLTGDKETIRQLTDAVGFRFQRQGDAFEHPSALIVLSPDGKVTRYLYGLTYLPFDLKMAVAEASAGRIGPTINRVLLFCFTYDPEGRTYVFNLLKVTGLVILFFAGTFLAAVLLKKKIGAPAKP
jgi:protein SCO1/2